MFTVPFPNPDIEFRFWPISGIHPNVVSRPVAVFAAK